MEKENNVAHEIVNHIRSKISNGNLEAFYILTNIAYEMLLDGRCEEDIKSRIDDLLKNPIENETKN